MKIILVLSLVILGLLFLVTGFIRDARDSNKRLDQMVDIANRALERYHKLVEDHSLWEDANDIRKEEVDPAKSDWIRW